MQIRRNFGSETKNIVSGPSRMCARPVCGGGKDAEDRLNGREARGSTNKLGRSGENANTTKVEAPGSQLITAQIYG